MLDWKSNLVGLLGALGNEGVEKVLKEIDAVVAGAEDPAERFVLKMMAESLDKYGSEGISIALKQLSSILDGDAVDLNFDDLEMASDALALLQNAEADKKKMVRDYADRVADFFGHVLGKLLGGFLSKP